MMSGIEAGSAVASKANGYEPKSESNKRQEAGQVNSNVDNVSIKNYFAKLAVDLLGKVDDLLGDTPEGSRQSILEQVMMEASSRVRIGGMFAPPSAPVSTDAGKAAAYQSESREAGENGSFKTEAEAILQAHAQAFGGDPFSPEATADRIVNFAVSFFPMFAADNPDMSHEEQVEAYREMVEGAIDEGFKDAMKILGSLPNDISANIEKTRSLVDEKLDAFFNHLAGEGAEEEKKAVSDGVWRDYVGDFFNVDEKAE